MTESSPLGSLSPADFLKDYWQKRPLLVRGAVPDLGEPVDPDTLAGLACEDDVESRLVTGDRRSQRWTVEDGPFSVERFVSLPSQDWTLLVQGVDQWVPAVSRLIDRFRFLPNWRLDDVMVSYAVDGGGVGPHFDSYDVFLLQGHGQRRWLVGDACDDTTPLLTHDRLRLLRRMEARQDLLLDPGDMLYLPPGLAHDGIAIGASITYSIGFRAPSAAEAILGVAETAVAGLGGGQRYADPDLAPQDNPGEITPSALARLRDLVLARLDDPALFARWLGCWSTEPKSAEAIQPPDLHIDSAALAALLDSGVGLRRNEGSRFAYVENGKGVLTLFVDGEAYACGGPTADLARHIAGSPVLRADRLRWHFDDPGAAGLLVALTNAGALYTE